MSDTTEKNPCSIFVDVVKKSIRHKETLPETMRIRQNLYMGLIEEPTTHSRENGSNCLVGFNPSTIVGIIMEMPKDDLRNIFCQPYMPAFEDVFETVCRFDSFG